MALKSCDSKGEAFGQCIHPAPHAPCYMGGLEIDCTTSELASWSNVEDSMSCHLEIKWIAASCNYCLSH